MSVEHTALFIAGFKVDLKTAKELISDEVLAEMEDEADTYEYFNEAASTVGGSYMEAGSFFTGEVEYYITCAYPKPLSRGLYRFDDITALSAKLEHIRLRAKERGIDLGPALLGAAVLEH
jgi:hypothetical protein